MGEEVEQLWLATRDMAVEVKKEGFDTREALELLRSAKVMIIEWKKDPKERTEFHSRAQGMIADIQMILFQAAQPLGDEFEKRWGKELGEVMRGKKVGEFPMPSETFVKGMPRSIPWVRVQVPEGMDVKEARDAARDAGVDVKEEDDYLLLSGNKEGLRKVLDVISGYMKVNKDGL